MNQSLFFVIIAGTLLLGTGCRKESSSLEPKSSSGNQDSIQTAAAPKEIWNVYAGKSGRLYAGTFSGLSISTDQGNTWTASVLPLDTNSRSINCMLELTPSLVFIGSGGCAQTIGIMKSTDGGKSFAPSGTGLTTFCITSLDCKSTDTLFAGTLEGAFRSINGGSSWSRMGLAVSGRLSVFSVGYDIHGVLLAATDRGLHRSLNDGNSWTIADQDSTSSWRALARASSGAWLAYRSSSINFKDKGIVRSTDEGNSWAVINNSITDAQSGFIEAIAASANGFAAAITGREASRSTDDGITWSVCDTVPAPNFTSIAIDPAGYLFLGDFKRIYRSANNGTTWSAL